MIDFNLYTCAVSGHRKIDNTLDVERLKNIFISLIKEANIRTFLIGMAVGFDTICFNLLEEIKKTERIKIVAVIPCEKQDINYSAEQKKEYVRMLSVADEKIYVSLEYTKECMLKRNRYLVDNSSIIIVYERRKNSGTSYTKSYAIKKGVSVIKV